MKKRVFYLDFIRALSVIFIIVFHFNCVIGAHGVYQNVERIPIIFYQYKNGNLGQIGVSLFFIISGGGLMLTRQHEFKTKEYVKKRFFAIFPMFYLAYFCVTCYYFVRYASLNPFGVLREKASFILTILGMDGYLSPVIPNYYIIGEWFLGCIILFYFLFPFLRMLLLKTNLWISTICVFVIYAVAVNFYPFDSFPIEYFVLSRIMEFFFGMVAVQYISKIKKWHLCISCIMLVALFGWYIPVPQIYKTTIMGISLYIILAYIGQHISECYQNPFYIISKYSYPAYLLHHVIIDQICCRFDGIVLSLFDTYFLLIVCIIAIILCTFLYNKLFVFIQKILKPDVNKSDV